MRRADDTTYTVKRLYLSRKVIGRFKRTLADLEVERGEAVTFNEGAAEAFELFARIHEERKGAP